MLISRIFYTADDAQAAIGDLTQAGFRAEGTQLVTNASGEVSDAGLVKMGILPANAAACAAAVNQGNCLLIVEAPIGTSARATEILMIARPGDTGTPAAQHEAATRPDVPQARAAAAATAGAASAGAAWSGAAPLSERLGWPVLSSDTSAKKTSSFGMPLLWGGPSPLSSWLGWKLLSDNPTPLSSWLGTKVLSDDPTPLSTWMGRSVLIDNPTPLSSKFNLRVLSEEPAAAKPAAEPQVAKTE